MRRITERDRRIWTAYLDCDEKVKQTLDTLRFQGMRIEPEEIRRSVAKVANILSRKFL